MTDLDIQIDVPDDDDLGSPVRVLNGRWLPPWFRTAALAIIGALAAVLIGAYLVGRSGSQGDGSVEPSSSTAAPISSATASPAVNTALEAVQAWETFARSGDLATVAPYFDETGPQYGLFREAAANGFSGQAVGEGAPLDFSARNLAESAGPDLTTVSMDLVVTGPQGQEVFPFDLVFRDGGTRIWTVVDRRSPGLVALPPPADVVEAAQQNWSLFTAAVAVDDGPAAATAVSDGSRLLAEQVEAAARDAGEPGNPGAPLDDPEIFAQLVDRARAAGAPGDVSLLSLLDAGQRRTLVTGQLAAWTQVSADRVVATLVVDGKPVAAVPFVTTGDGWTFDLVEALRMSKVGTP